MRAAKIVVMLAITAVAAVTIFIILLLDAGAADAAMTAVPDTLALLEETIRVGSDGSAEVEVTAVLGRGGGGGLLLPFAFPAPQGFTPPSGPARFSDADAPQVLYLGHRVVSLDLLPGAQPGDTVRVLARVPSWYDMAGTRKAHGVHAVRREFVNTSRHVIAAATTRVVLPPGYMVQSVGDVVPKFDPKANPSPPFAIGTRDGRVEISQHAERVTPSGRMVLAFEMRAARRGVVALAAGLLLAVFYLARFRDILNPGKEV